MNSEIAAILKKANVKTDAFEPYGDGSGVAGGEVPGRVAFELWKAIRRLHNSTGVWPVIRGSGFEFYPDELPDDPLMPPTGDMRSLLDQRFSDAKALLAEDLGPGAMGLSMADFAVRADKAGIFRFEEAAEDTDELGWPEEPPDAEASFVALMQGDSDRPVKSVHLALVPAKQPWEAIMRLKFGGYNDCPMPSLLTALFREWHAQYGAEPVVITMDTIECLVAHPPKTEESASNLAIEHWLACEDIVSQGVRSLRGLAKNLWRSPTWYFWWD